MAVILAKSSAAYTDYTQNIVNQFPEWHVARRQRDSVISRLIDSTYGRTISQLINNETYNLFTQRTLSQASPSSHDKAYTIDVSDVADVPDRQSNLLKNSNFDLWSNYSRLPDNWLFDCDSNKELNDLVNVQLGSNYVGGSSLVLDTKSEQAITFGTIKLYQVFHIPSDMESSIFTLSVFHRRLGAEVIPSNYMFLYAKYTYTNGSESTVTKELTDNSGWIKTKLKLEPNGVLESIEVGIKYTTTLSVALAALQITGFQLLIGDVNTFWVKHEEDRPSFIGTPQTGLSVSITARNTEYTQYLTKIDEAYITKQLLPNSSIIDFLVPEVINWTPPEPVSINLLPGYDFQGNLIQQSLTIGSAATIAKYGWPSWVNGRLIKYDSSNPEYIIASYIPSFPIIGQVDYVEAIDTIKMMCIAEYNGNIWILSKLLPGSGLLHANSVSLILMCISSDLPKQENDSDPETSPMFILGKYSYPFAFQSTDGWGITPYGVSAYGGNTSFFTSDHFSMEFMDSYTIKTNMLNGVIGLISLRYNYFIHDESTASVFLLRDPRLDVEDGNIVVC